MTEEYTDNFDRTSTNRRDNFRTSVSPGLSLTINGAKTKGQIGASISALTYDTVDDTVNETTFFGGNVGVTWTPNPLLSISFTDRLARRDTPARTEPDDLGIRQGRSTFFSNTSTLLVNYRIGNVSTRGSYSLVIFDDKAPGGEDTLTQTFSAGAGTSIFQNTNVNLGYTHSNSNLSVSPDIVGHTVTGSLTRIIGPFTTAGISGSYGIFDSERGGSDAKVYRVALNSTHAIPEVMSISGRIGYARSDETVGDDRDSIEGGLTLSRNFARARVTLAYDQGLVETFLIGQNEGIVENRRVSASFSYPFPPNISTSLNVFHSWNKFTVGGIGSTGTNRTTEDIGGSADLSIQLLRWLRTSLGYSIQHTKSSAPGGDFVENTGRVSLSGTF